MKRFIALFICFMIIFTFFGCDYYTDERISIILPEPDSIGLVEYVAGVSTKKNSARIDLLRYELDVIPDGQINIVLPETIKNESGTEFAIDSFGGAIGTNAPLQKFSLVIHVRESITEEKPIALTVDVGSLPLNTSDWNDIQICFLADGTVVDIPLESVVFRSDKPLAYKLYLKEEAQNGAVFDATDSDKWYEKPKQEYLGGEKVTIKIKPSEGDVERSLDVTHKPVELVEVQNEYMQYEFIMPYHNVTITIVDEQD